MQRKLFDKNKKRTGQGRVEAEAKPRCERERVVATYKVAHSDELLEFLLRKRNTSRNNVKALLTRRLVLVNGSLVTQYNFPLAKDDEVKIVKTPVKEEGRPLAKKNSPMPLKRLPFKILFENEEFIAIDKPVGLLSVESDKEKECAFKEVLAYLSSREKNARPYVLHRIDKETSGVLLFAKDIKLHSMLKMHWNELVQTREYYALTEGVFEKKEDTVASYLKENANNLVYVTADPSGQKAITRYKVVAENLQYSLLKVNIETGKKNQIRVQMNFLSHPVVGDEKYGFTKNPLGRLGLHASKLEFIHPVTRELISIASPLPPSFRSLF